MNLELEEGEEERMFISFSFSFVQSSVLTDITVIVKGDD